MKGRGGGFWRREWVLEERWGRGVWRRHVASTKDGTMAVEDMKTFLFFHSC